MMEVLVVVGLFGMLITLGLLLSMDVWRGSSFQSEQDVVLSLLYKARSRAVSNINEANHGLYIDEVNGKYILFEGNNYGASTSTVDFPIGNGVDFDNFTNNAETDGVVFSARTGNTSGPSFTMIGQGKTRTFDINPEGGITW